MPIDKSVYILVTNRGKGKREYRVADFFDVFAAGLVENPDYPLRQPQLNRQELTNFFDDSRVITDRKLAEGYALAIIDKNEEGAAAFNPEIVWLNYSSVQYPKASYDDMRRAAYEMRGQFLPRGLR